MRAGGQKRGGSPLLGEKRLWRLLPLAVLANAKEVIKVAEKEAERAIKFTVFGIKPLDALHIGLAEKGSADYFCTCDDKLLRNSKKVKDLSIRAINPVDLVQEIEK